MQKHKKLWLFVNTLIISVTLFVGCASRPPSENPTPVTLKEPVAIALQSLGEKIDVTRYYSHSKTTVFEQGQKVREKDELVDFDLKTESVPQVTLPTSQKGRSGLGFRLEVIRKDGLIDLHDLAFPEQGEQLDVVYAPNGDVLKSGSFPSTSVFYVPPVSLPDRAVKVGDTWTLQKRWMGAKNRIPLQLNITSILKDFVKYRGEVCARIEVSGEVGIVAGLQSLFNFSSRVGGYLLFSVDSGRVLWSHIQSVETIKSKAAEVVVNSCLVSKTDYLEQYEKVRKVDKLTCTPGKTDEIANP